MATKSTKGISTKSVHAGEGKGRANRSVTTAIAQTSTYFFTSAEELIAHKEKREPREEYGRYQNPTRSVAEAKLAELEGGEDALLTSSGMAAVTTTLFGLLNQGDHLILIGEVYSRTRELCDKLPAKMGVEVSVLNDEQTLRDVIQPNTKIIFAEVPTNPHLRVIDLASVVAIAKEHRIRTIIDSTLATPYNLQPLTLGADLVIHSGTKYFGGHNDLLAGVVIGRKSLIAPLREMHWVLGAVLDGHTAYLLLRGLKTFALRMERHNQNALRIAQYLERHPKVKKVFYPGVESHADYAVATRLMSGFGGLLSVDLGSKENTIRFVNALTIPYLAASLGGVESLVEPHAIMVGFDLLPDSELARSIEPGLVRLSIGIEDVEDLLADIEQALGKV
jgi:cystathionine gamma-synthase